MADEVAEQLDLTEDTLGIHQIAKGIPYFLNGHFPTRQLDWGQGRREKGRSECFVRTIYNLSIIYLSIYSGAEWRAK